MTELQPQNNSNNQNSYANNNQPLTPAKQHYEPQTKQQQPINYNQRSIIRYLMSVAFFIIAFAVFVAVWAINKFAIKYQLASSYYEQSLHVSSAFASLGLTTSPNNTKTALGISMSLLFSWMLWKGPLFFFTYNCIQRQESRILKFVTFGIGVLICLAADIVLTIFLMNIYTQMMYFGLYTLITILLAVINNKSLQRVKQSLCDSAFPLIYIGFLYLMQNLLLPALYHLQNNHLSNQSTIFLIIYLYPIIDLILFAMLLFGGSYVSMDVKNFCQKLHYYLLGYGIGYIFLIGYTEVEFYYYLGYYIFRNVFCHWVMWKWESVVNVPPVLPGWIIPYYFSYVLNFIPIIGVGNIIVSVGYYSVILTGTSTVLYSLPSSLYPSNTFSTFTLSDFPLNTSFQGNTFWLAAIIVWIATTFSQKYPKRRPLLKDIAYYIVGIYLFYLGLSSGITTGSLMTYSVI